MGCKSRHGFIVCVWQCWIIQSRFVAWNTGRVVNMTHLFTSAFRFNGDISAWDVSRVKDISFSLDGTSMFDPELSLSNVSRMTNIFYDLDNPISDHSIQELINGPAWQHPYLVHYNQDISIWDTSRVTNLQAMMLGNTQFDQDISTWDVSSVTDVSLMFFNVTSFNQDLSPWKPCSESNWDFVLYNATSFDQDFCSWTDNTSSPRVIVPKFV